MTNYSYYLYPERVVLESGESLEGLKIAYHVLGNECAKKTVWVCHALSGNSNVYDWWAGLFGSGQLFNPEEYRIICANVIGSCYGSTGPDDLEDARDFPLITIRDMVNAHQLLADYLEIKKVNVLIGSSLGGQQALEWSIVQPNFAEQLILIATNAQHSPFGRAFNEAQRLALQADPTFGQKGGGVDGIKAARAVAMLSYRSYTDFTIKQSDEDDQIDNYRASSYVSYQGEKFISRFKAGAYYTLSKAMDSHDVSRDRLGLREALSRVSARTLVVGVDSDVLFPLSEQELLSDLIPLAELGVIRSPYGHDAFLIEYDQLNNLINKFLNNDNLDASNADKYKERPTVLRTQSLKK